MSKIKNSNLNNVIPDHALEEDETSLDLAGEIFENNFDFFKGRLNSMMTFLVPNGF